MGSWRQTQSLPVSDRPKSPYLFTKDDCQAALLAVEVEPTKQSEKERKVEAEVTFTLRQKEVNKKIASIIKHAGKRIARRGGRVGWGFIG